MLAAFVASGCASGAAYRRPAVDLPATFRDVSADPAQAGGTGAASSEAASLADTPWFGVFNDTALTALVKTAIDNNFDVRVAAERVIQARERFNISRSQLWPTVDAGPSATSNRRSEIGSIIVPPGAPVQIETVRADVGVAWELDVWGRIRRANEAAKAQYLATEDARRAVLTTLVADVSQRYFQLRALDAQLEIARQTRLLAADGYRLTDLRRSGGVGTALDVRQAEQLQFIAEGQIAGLERSIVQTENGLSVLLGRAPAEIARGVALDAIGPVPAVPPGVPASLLTRRPDIRAAEQRLIAANAQIGVARAELLPRLSLTGVFGFESRALGDLLTAPARLFNVTGDLTAPIFNAGRLRSNVKVAESVQRELVVEYERTIYQALRDVSDALAGYRKTTEQRAAQERLVASLRDASRLSTERYQGGIDSYLQVLDSERSRFQSELGLASLKQQELTAIVDLYRALGGGWQDSEPADQ